MADTGGRCVHTEACKQVGEREAVGHVDRKQSEDASMQTMQSSVIIVTAVTKETICEARPVRRIYLSGPA
jgi:hypothetical protein